MTGTTWQVESVIRVVDGDTVRLVRSRPARLDLLELIARDAGDDGVSVRLVWVDTPERGRPGYVEARADLAAWIERAPRPLTVVCYEGGAGWDRVLGDLLDADGRSASGCTRWPPTGGSPWLAPRRVTPRCSLRRRRPTQSRSRRRPRSFRVGATPSVSWSSLRLPRRP